MRLALTLIFCLLAAAVPARAAEPPVILVVGDSLSAGYGLAPGQGGVALLQQRLKKQGYGHRVVNASVSGETTDGGVQRLDRALATHRPGLVIIELGGNDGLRGLPVARVRANLELMITRSRAAGAEVLLLAVRPCRKPWPSRPRPTTVRSPTCTCPGSASPESVSRAACLCSSCPRPTRARAAAWR
jgi:acyl-CoA thioesterase-1